jgi:FKBP-type peptidyl-prolyl cis-trans isomerase FkpA
MKKVAFYSLVVALAAASCGKNMGYRTSKSGMQYKIVSGSGKDSMKIGDMLKVFIENRIEDSVLGSSYEAGHQMITYDTTNFSRQDYSFVEVLPQLKIGDSLVCKLSTDSIVAKFFKGAPPEQIPPFLVKKGRSLYTYLKIVKKYSDTAEFRKDSEAEMVLARAYGEKMQKKQMEEQQKQMAEMQKKAEEQKKLDAPKYAEGRKKLEDFLGAKKASLIKTPGGAYVEMLQPGSGPACENGKIVSVRYKGTLLDGTLFDTNMPMPGDTMKKPAYTMMMGQGGSITGFMEGIATMRKGARAKVYIPAEIGYENQASGPVIKPFDNLMFEIYIEEVVSPKGGATMQTAPAADPNAKGGK